MIIRTLLAAAFFAIVASASAQPTPSPATARAPVAPHGCKKPGEFPGRLASDANRRNWIKDANDYLACLKKYAMEHQSVAQPLYEQAKPHVDAANAAIEEHNKAAAEFKTEQEKGS